MKTIYAIFTLLVFAATSSLVAAQDYPDEYLGLPGDNLNLYAVMTLFQESETLEKFEQELNSQEQMINNLDLNGDKLIDYISVSDFVDGNIHNIVLRTSLDRNEQQDVAVFVVEKLSNGAVQIQLIGDEALYGPNYIVEPIYAETSNPGYTGKTYSRNANVVTTNYYEIAAGLLSGICIILDMWYGDHPGTGITIQDTGVPGGLITGTIITGTILTGITIITLTIVTGTVTGAETIVPTIAAECTCTFLQCM